MSDNITDRQRFHNLIDLYFDNPGGDYNDMDLEVSFSRRDLNPFAADAIDLEVIEMVPDWDGNLDGVNGIMKPNAVFINGKRVSGAADKPFVIDGLSPTMRDATTATMTLFVRNATITKRGRIKVEADREAESALKKAGVL